MAHIGFFLQDFSRTPGSVENKSQGKGTLINLWGHVINGLDVIPYAIVDYPAGQFR
jgi:hypothetical protein